MPTLPAHVLRANGPDLRVAGRRHLSRSHRRPLSARRWRQRGRARSLPADGGKRRDPVKGTVGRGIEDVVAPQRRETASLNIGAAFLFEQENTS